MDQDKELKLAHNMRMVAAHIEQSLLQLKMIQEAKENMGLLCIKSSDTVERIVATHILARAGELSLDISYEDLNREMIYEYVLKGYL